MRRNWLGRRERHGAAEVLTLNRTRGKGWTGCLWFCLTVLFDIPSMSPGVASYKG